MIGAKDLVPRRAAPAIALLGLAAALSACISPRRATVRELHHRAVFDLGCPAETVSVQRIGARTRAAVGCGRRLVYVELCDPALPADEACGWQLDTPSFTEAEWPQNQQALREIEQQRRAAAPPRWPAPKGSAGPDGDPNRGTDDDPDGSIVGGSGGGSTDGATAATSEGDASGRAPAERGKRRGAQRRGNGRSFATDLYDADADEPLDQNRNRDRRGVYDQR